MNLNHIAKKPFFDLFYRTPAMALMLRTAFHDAGTFCTTSRTGYRIKAYHNLIQIVVPGERLDLRVNLPRKKTKDSIGQLNKLKTLRKKEIT